MMNALLTRISVVAVLLLSSNLHSTSIVQQTLSPAELFQRDLPAIVRILTSGLDRRQSGLGTGFVVRSDGWIVTALHVVQGATEAQIRFNDGSVSKSVRLVASDPDNDVALLKINASGLQAVTIALSDEVATGEKAYTIGNPEGLSNTISDGLISGRRIVEGRQKLQISVPNSNRHTCRSPIALPRSVPVHSDPLGITSAG